jgi:adenosylcobinamide-GDP ribazoletransferase
VRTPLPAARAAFAFLTRIPVGRGPFTTTDWTWAPAHFPLVGLALGCILAIVQRLLWPLGAFADATLVVAVSLLLTGALHEDGLADTSDALGGGFDRERVLEILKDSRIGTFGACALLVSIVGRIAMLTRLGRDATLALVLVGCAARVGPVWQMIVLPQVTRASAKSKNFAGTRAPQGWVATAWLAATSAIAVALHAMSAARLLSLAVAMLIVTGVTTWRFWQRIGGITGDFLGATEQLCEVAGYAVLAWNL